MQVEVRFQILQALGCLLAEINYRPLDTNADFDAHQLNENVPRRHPQEIVRIQNADEKIYVGLVLGKLLRCFLSRCLLKTLRL